MSDKIYSPFTPDQVKHLNAYQGNSFWHPFTCARRDDTLHPDEGALVATIGGWICPYCDYRQDWAHQWMTNPIKTRPRSPRSSGQHLQVIKRRLDFLEDRIGSQREQEGVNPYAVSERDALRWVLHQIKNGSNNNAES